MTGRHAHLLRTALGACDAVAATAAVCAAYVLRFHVLTPWLPVAGRTDILPGRYAAALPAAVVLLVAATALAGLYDARRVTRPPGLADTARLSFLGALALATVALLYWSEFQYSRATLLLAGVLYGPAAALARRVALRLAARNARTLPAFLIGGGAPAARISSALATTGWPSFRLVGVLPVGEDTAPASLPRVASLETACEELARGRIREVLVAIPNSHADEVPGILTRLEQTTADVRLVPDLGGAVLVNPGASLVGDVPLLALRERPLYGLRAALKRGLDAVLSAVLLVALSPALLLIGLAVRATSRGPALFAQERMGLDGRSFRMWKFRTMQVDAERATGPVFARPGDPRTTPVGRVLRRFSLDELPQLWNVLRGDMSLVGPRPERAPFIEEFRRRLPGYMARHTVKAGITGWAQVHGLRGDTSLEERLRYDLEYVDRWSLSLDLEILGRTALQVIVGRNAY